MTRMIIPPVDVAPPEVRLPADLLVVLRTLNPVQLGVAISLLHPADAYVATARAAVDVSDLRHFAVVARTEISHDVAAAALAVGMSTEPIRPLQEPRVPTRCDSCHRAGAELRMAVGRWTWTEAA